MRGGGCPNISGHDIGAKYELNMTDCDEGGAGEYCG